MTSLQQAIRDRVDSLVADLEDLVREEALRLLSESLSGGAALPSRQSRPGSGARGRRASGAGASDAVASKVLGYIQQNPNVRAEAVRAALGMNKAAWVKVSSQLLAQKRLTKSGQKRGTAYSAAR